MVDFSNVLDARHSLLAFEDQRAQNEGIVPSNLTGLYKALGGGWASFEQHRRSERKNPIERFTVEPLDPGKSMITSQIN